MINLTSSKLKFFFRGRPFEEDEKTNYNWEKIFTRHIPAKGLVSKLYKELLTLNREELQLENGQKI